MSYYKIEPEVAGGLGENTVLDTSVHPADVSHLNYEFDGWLGDEILESFPCFIITSNLKDKLESNQCTGIAVDEVEVTMSETFKDLYPDKTLPEFHWFRITGESEVSDFGLKDDCLTVSQKALDILKSVSFSNCEIEMIE